ncbi:MAG TPA: EAL domain-containing protein [Thermoanaerobaculia bacterium]|nr:EAL domain-containing protein [Thermoanaerobaculia bacterium]
MPEFSLAVAATLTAQIVGAAMMSLLLLGFYRQYGKSYLLHWTYAWGALAIYHLATSTALALMSTHPPMHPLRITATFVSSISGYLQTGWLLFGAYELVRRRPVRILSAQQILAGLTAFAIISAAILLVTLPTGSVRFATRVGLHSLLAGFAAAYASVALWRARRRRSGIGFTVLSGAFAAYALESLQYVFVDAATVVAGTLSEYATYLGYVDFVLQSVMAVGMIACLLEDEREATELASQEIEHLAYHDALTGLPNRPLFIDRLIVALAHAHRAHAKLAVLFLDLDRFKDINDSLGHSIGDALLKAVAERIRRCVREGDTVARFGGDEFTLLIPKIDQVEDAAKIGQKILETLKIPFDIHDQELFVTTSIGMSIFPNDGADPETLVRNADTAMYRAKEQGRDNYQLYAPAMNARALERLALENLLRKAIAQKELVLYYQPIIDAHTRVMTGVEALIRWRHPELGLLLPAHFISVAEISGLILPIGQWVLETACRQIKAWQRKHDQLTMSVNLSARQFQQPDLVDQVRSALHQTGIEPWQLQLEITESNAMQNAENSMYTLRELKSIGVRIAMDDFGTGYSSLNYLKRFPIDTLKLDRSFVSDIEHDPSDAAIASAVISMAHSLALKVVAEGVETLEQFDYLRQQGCDAIQGFFFSQPVPAEEVERYFAVTV